MADSSNLSAAKRNLLAKYLRGNLPHDKERLACIVPRTPGHIAPLSFSQQQVWLHSQIAPKDVPLYNETLTLHRTGALAVNILGRAMDEIIRRHEIWRTTFDIVDGEPVQIVHSPKPGFEFQTVDLRTLASEKRAAEAMRLACYDARKAFDLKTGPLLRGLLVRLSDSEHRLFLTFHQLIFDGVTAYHVFLPELVSIYEAFSQGQSSPLTEPVLQYADYAVWQRSQLKEERVGAQLKHWEEILRGELPVLQWPLDRARPPVQTYRGDIQTFALSEAELQPLKALSQRHNVSLFMILVAGLIALLHRYTGQEDIIVGAPTAGRNARELQGMLGYFLNVLPLRVDVSGDPPFSELLRRVKEAVIGALSNQDVPFTQLVETIRPIPDPSRNPFFQVAISLEPPVKIAGNGWAATQSDVPTGASKLDLYIDVDESPDGIHGPVSYNPDVFDASTICNMLEHWRTLLVGAATDPDRPVSDLPVLTARDRQQLVADWNNTTAEYPRDRCIHELFADQCQRTPQTTALQMGPEVLSFRDLDQRSSRLASYLHKLGVQTGGRVVVLMERSFEVVIAMLATLKAGAAFVPLDASYPADRLAFMLRDCDPSAVITRECFRGKLPKLPATVICLDTDTKQIAAESIETPTATCKPDDPAYVIYTSGSTGEPRGVVATHRACLNRFCWMWREYPFAAGEVCCQKTNLGFVDSIWEIFGPLLAGVPSVIIPPEVLRDPEELLSMLAGNGVTRLVLVPSLLRSLLDYAPDLGARVPQLKLWSCSGEVLPLELARRFRAAHPAARLLNIYGSSEVAADVTCYEVKEVEGLGSVPIGKPISNTQIYIVDRYGNPVPVGVRGEIYVGGDGVAVGYWRRPELTAERFVENAVKGVGEGRQFRTGDLGRWRSQGEIEYLGRVDSQVKLRGMRLELGEVEGVLAGHAGVGEAAVGLSGEGDQERLIAYVTSAAQEQAPEGGELRRYMRSKLPEHMVPSGYVLVEKLPLLPSGKVNRKALAGWPGKVLGEKREIVEARTQVEEKLAEMWQELLQVGEVGVEQNFFELGGHSLLVLQVIARIRKAFEVEIAVRVLFEQPTIAELATAVEKALAGGQKVRTPVLQRRPRSVAADAEDLLAQLDCLSQGDAQSLLRRVLDGKHTP